VTHSISRLSIVTEAMSECNVTMVAEFADILQIGSRSMENYSLLEAAAKSGRSVLLKRGMVATLADMFRSAQIILDNGNPNVILCERGIRTFETATRNTFDVAAIALAKHVAHLSSIADLSHAAGNHEFVPALARIALPPAPMDSSSKCIRTRTKHGAMGAIARLRLV